MTADPRLAADAVLPILLRPGRGIYGLFIRDALAEAGFADMPANGGYVLGLAEPDGVPVADIVADLGVSRQNAGQLIDALVVRGYLSRTDSHGDQRRTIVTLTERGKAASNVVYQTVVEIDARLVAAVGEEKVMHTKETLLALLSLRPVSN